MAPHHVILPRRRHTVSAVASPLHALCGLPAAGAWLWLGTATAAAGAASAIAAGGLEAAALAAGTAVAFEAARPLAPLVLLDGLPGLLVAAITEVPRHG
jgi:hypothetical protein